MLWDGFRLHKNVETLNLCEHSFLFRVAGGQNSVHQVFWQIVGCRVVGSTQYSAAQRHRFPIGCQVVPALLAHFNVQFKLEPGIGG